MNKTNWIQINKKYTTFENVTDEDITNLNLYTKDTEGGGENANLTAVVQPSLTENKVAENTVANPDVNKICIVLFVK